MALAPSQGLANFEKCINKLEQLLPAAIAQQRRKKKSKKLAEEEEGSSDIDVVEALIKLISTNYVDEGCNAPPDNLARLEGITASEALSNSYRELVSDFVSIRDRWARAAMMPPSSRTSSPANSSRASSRASSSAAQRFRPAGFLNGAPLTNRFSQGANDNDDDDDNHQHRRQHGGVMMVPREEMPPSEVYRDPAHSAAEFKTIGEEVRSVRDLQQDLNTIVEGQQEPLDTLERNTDRAALHVENGRKELYQALKYTSVGSAIVGGIVGAIVAGPAGMALGAQSGMAIASSVAAGGAVGAFTGTKIASAAQEASGDAEFNRHAPAGSKTTKIPPQEEKK